MLEAAQQAYVLYDPRERLDAMHSALFERANITRFRLPFMGSALQSDLVTLDLLPSLLNAVAEDRLTPRSLRICCACGGIIRPICANCLRVLMRTGARRLRACFVRTWYRG